MHAKWWWGKLSLGYFNDLVFMKKTRIFFAAIGGY
jgi:hypothetical protein